MGTDEHFVAAGPRDAQAFKSLRNDREGMSDSTAETANDDLVYWGALGLFGLAALVGSVVDLSAAGPGLSVVARLLSGVLLLAVAGWALTHESKPATPDSTLVRLLVVGGSAFYAAVTFASLV